MAYDAPTIAALASGGLVLRDLLWIAGWDSDGDPATWGFSATLSNITLNVIGGLTGISASRSYYGKALTGVPAIVDAIGLESRSADFELNQLHATVRDMVFGARIKGARVELHRALFNPATWAIVSTPFVRFVGRLDTAEPVTAAAGSEGGIVLSCSSDPIELTRVNPALKSDESLQALHPGDTFRQYDTVGLIDRRWGQAKGKAD